MNLDKIPSRDKVVKEDNKISVIWERFLARLYEVINGKYDKDTVTTSTTGIICKSPNGSVRKRIGIDNSGNVVAYDV